MTMPDHERFMHRCIELAELSREHGEVAVGSLIVDAQGRILAEAEEERRTKLDVTGHAEVVAVRRATRRLGTLHLDGCTLYTSAEPCFMCAFVIRHARVAEVVIGAPVDGIGGVSSDHPILTDPDIATWTPPPRVVTGVLLEECLALRRKD